MTSQETWRPDHLMVRKPTEPANDVIWEGCEKPGQVPRLIRLIRWIKRAVEQ